MKLFTKIEKTYQRRIRFLQWKVKGVEWRGEPAANNESSKNATTL